MIIDSRRHHHRRRRCRPRRRRSSGGSSLHLFLHSSVQIYELHIFIISSSSFPGILRTNLMTNSQLAC